MAGYLSHKQVAALAAAVERQAEVVRFLSYTGLRWGETAALRVQYFDVLSRRVMCRVRSRNPAGSFGALRSHGPELTAIA